ncbi:MAG: phosphodiesterase [Actinomycetota bacterium]
MTWRTLVHISDPHIATRPGQGIAAVVDTGARFAEAIRVVNALEPRPEAVIVTGDLVDSAAKHEYDFLVSLLDQLRCPYFLLVGNHDDREVMRGVFPPEAGVDLHHSLFQQYRLRFDGLNVLALDTAVTGRPHGELCAKRLDWLATSLQADPLTPTLIAMHHPPMLTGDAAMDDIGLTATSRAGLAEVIGIHPQITAIACGHLHRSCMSIFCGVRVACAPSTAHQMPMRLGGLVPLSFHTGVGGFLVHAWRPGQPLTTHLIPVEASAQLHCYDDLLTSTGAHRDHEVSRKSANCGHLRNP